MQSEERQQVVYNVQLSMTCTVNMYSTSVHMASYVNTMSRVALPNGQVACVTLTSQEAACAVPTHSIQNMQCTWLNLQEEHITAQTLQLGNEIQLLRQELVDQDVR